MCWDWGSFEAGFGICIGPGGMKKVSADKDCRWRSIFQRNQLRVLMAEKGRVCVQNSKKSSLAEGEHLKKTALDEEA